jgi:hypothetical protein
MSELARVDDVETLGGFRLRLTFSDGLVRELDFTDALDGPVFDRLRDPAYFSTSRVDRESRTLAWPNGVDLDPDVLHGDHDPASGSAPSVIAEYRLRPTA